MLRQSSAQRYCSGKADACWANFTSVAAVTVTEPDASVVDVLDCVVPGLVCDSDVSSFKPRETLPPRISFWRARPLRDERRVAVAPVVMPPRSLDLRWKPPDCLRMSGTGCWRVPATQDTRTVATAPMVMPPPNYWGTLQRPALTLREAAPPSRRWHWGNRPRNSPHFRGHQ